MDSVEAPVTSRRSVRLLCIAAGLLMAAIPVVVAAGELPLPDLLTAAECADPPSQRCAAALPEWAYRTPRRPVSVCGTGPRPDPVSPRPTIPEGCSDLRCIVAFSQLQDLYDAGVPVDPISGQRRVLLGEIQRVNRARTAAFESARRTWMVRWAVVAALLAAGVASAVAGAWYQPSRVAVGRFGVVLGNRRFLWQDIESVSWDHGPPRVVTDRGVFALTGCEVAPDDVRRLRDACELARSAAAGGGDPEALAQVQALRRFG